MNKKDLVALVAGDVNLPMTKVEPIIDVLIHHITTALHSGEEVRIHGLGAFSVKETAERAGRNPQTGETITIAAKRKVSFKATKGLV